MNVAPRISKLLSASLWVGVSLGLGAGARSPDPGVLWAAESAKAEETAPGVPELQAKLKAALSSGDYVAAASVVDSLLAMGTPEAVLALTRNALRGANYALEKRVGAGLCHLKDPAAKRKICEEALKNPDYRARIVLLAVVARMVAEDPKALDTIHAALRDPSKPVVLTALSWLRELRRTDSVEPLIDFLEERERKAADRIYFDTLRALREITGFEIGSAGEWKSFWEAQKRGLSAPKKPRGESKTAVVRSRFFSVELESDRVLFVIDISGSMSEKDPYVEPPRGEKEAGKAKTGVVKPVPKEKIDKSQLPENRRRIYRVKEELIRCIRELPPQVHFGVLAFNHELFHLWESRTLRPAGPREKAKAIEWVKALQETGATRTDYALREALSIPEVDTIVVLTDGAPQDEKNQRLDIDSILRQVKEQNRFVRARIETVSFLQIRDSRMRRFVRELALQNDGGEPHLLP